MSVGEIYLRLLKKNRFERPREFQKTKWHGDSLNGDKEGSGRKGSPKERRMDQKAVCLTLD